MQSALKFPYRKSVTMSSKKRLVLRFSASQGVEGYAAFIKVDLCPHQSMRPVRIDFEPVAQQAHFALLCRPSQIDHPALGRELRIEFPTIRKVSPPRGRKRSASLLPFRSSRAAPPGSRSLPASGRSSRGPAAFRARPAPCHLRPGAARRPRGG